MSSMKNKDGQPRLWRSLAEYDQDPEFQKYLQNEFPTPLTESVPDSKQRRRFMQLMSASFAMTGAAACHWEQDKLLPMSRRSEGVIPGVPRYYYSAMELGGVGVPLKVKSYDGRPIKVDGHPDHPDTLGASGVFEQASCLGMFDPDRSRGPAQMAGGKAKDVSQKAFDEFASKHFEQFKASQGAGLVFLTEPSTSRTVAAAKRALREQLPRAEWHEYEPVNQDNVRQGSQLALGDNYRMHAELQHADVLLTLDADPLSSGPESLAQVRAFSAGRDPESGSMNRLYAVESSLSPTGGQADHRLALRSSLVKAFTAALEVGICKALGVTPSQTAPAAQFLKDAKIAKFLKVLTKDLVAHRSRSAVMVGPSQPAVVHALVHRINRLLDNVGKTISYSLHAGTSQSRIGLKHLVSKLGAAKTLVIVDANPVYTTTGDVAFEAALAKVPVSIHLGLYRDETARKCTWHAPVSHYLESWGDSLSYNGTRLITQPLIKPLYGSRSVAEYLALFAGNKADGQALVRRSLNLAGDKAWRRAVHDGMVAGPVAKRSLPRVKTLAAIKFAPAELGANDASSLEVNFVADSRIHDGRFANNGWLQETPEHSMKLTWGNAAFISPGTATQLGVKDCHVVQLTVAGRTLSIPALISPGQAPGSVKIALGYGRTEAGVVAGTAHPFDAEPVEPVGVSAYALRGVDAWDVAPATLKATGTKVKLATTQDKHPMDDLGREAIQERLPQIVRQDTLSGFKKQPDKVQHAVHHPPLLSLWHEPISYEGYKWGMTIDLNKCNGCSACVVACNAENNIPVVGKDQVLMGRELHWMRIDRYWQGDDPDKPQQVHSQPVICQHCEHAPCEEVCPVAATSHSSEGLNDMTYNRCIGTRYCSNNCPYKVRRFNYFNFNLDLKEKRNETKRMALNPEVTVRFRGVMEKCSFCVQRIQNAKIPAKNAGRRLKDQEVTSACQDACAAGAIEFGDLNLAGSKVSEKAKSPRGYALLEELNVRPRVTYLARITNPHPELSVPSKKDDAHHAPEGNSNSHG